MTDEGTGNDTPATEGDDKTLLAGKYKSPEDLVKAYKELESKIGTMGTENSELREFAQRMAPFIVVDPDSGQMAFNEPVVKQALGINTDQPEKKETPTKREEKKETVVDQESITEIVNKALEKALGASVNPLRERLDRRDAGEWVDGMKKKHSDFEKYQPDVLKYLQDAGLRVESQAQLEDAYAAVKHRKGGFMDKTQAEQERKEYIRMLEETGAVPRPGAGGFEMKEPAEMTGRDLLGLSKDFGESDISKDTASKTLLGKPVELLSRE